MPWPVSARSSENGSAYGVGRAVVADVDLDGRPVAADADDDRAAAVDEGVVEQHVEDVADGGGVDLAGLGRRRAP